MTALAIKNSAARPAGWSLRTRLVAMLVVMLGLDFAFWMIGDPRMPRQSSEFATQDRLFLVVETALGPVGHFVNLRDVRGSSVHWQNGAAASLFALIVTGFYSLIVLGVNQSHRERASIVLRHAGYAAIFMWFILGFIISGLRVS